MLVIVAVFVCRFLQNYYNATNLSLSRFSEYLEALWLFGSFLSIWTIPLTWIGQQNRALFSKADLLKYGLPVSMLIGFYICYPKSFH